MRDIRRIDRNDRIRGGKAKRGKRSLAKGDAAPTAPAADGRAPGSEPPALKVGAKHRRAFKALATREGGYARRADTTAASELPR